MSSIKEVIIQRFQANSLVEKRDVLSVEEPLEIVLKYKVNDDIISKPISITMRTPNNDRELAIGFLFTESILTDKNQIEKINTSIDNRVIVTLKDNIEIDVDKLKRNFYTTSSCGVCGKASLDAVKTIYSTKNTKENEQSSVDINVILSLKNKINEHQSNFSQTGGIHASALFDSVGTMLSLFEDVGRHNALDKLIGHYFLSDNFDLSKKILLLSGRASFELIQKAAMAHLKIVCAIGAPSSLAVDLAQEFGITLIGFLKQDSFNIYTHPNRIKL